MHKLILSFQLSRLEPDQLARISVFMGIKLFHVDNIDNGGFITDSLTVELVYKKSFIDTDSPKNYDVKTLKYNVQPAYEGRSKIY